MQFVDVILCTEEAGQVFEHTSYDSPTAYKDGYSHVKQLLETHADWLIKAQWKPVAEHCVRATVQVRIGPAPFWSTEYLEEHGLGKYKFLA